MDGINLNGQVRERDEWRRTVWPGTKQTACKGLCDCELVLAVEGEAGTVSPWLVSAAPAAPAPEDLIDGVIRADVELEARPLGAFGPSGEPVFV